MTKLVNGQVWKDTDGNNIHAHGGCILHDQSGLYYWYGEDRRKNWYVNCYKSSDLVNWEFIDHVLTTDSITEQTRVRANLSLGTEKNKVNIERPKVVYNELTKKYVMWMHFENGHDYGDAAVAVASSDYPQGPYTYHGSFRPFGFMSRDLTVYKDEQNVAFLISSARENADIHIYRLSDDYLNVNSLVNRLWSNEYREAPALFKRDGMLYMINSFCTGWDPNQAKYAITESINANWSDLQNLGDSTTYRSQPAFVLKVNNDFLYWGDRWDASNYNNSGYVVYPINCSSKKLVLEHTSCFDGI